MYIHTVQERKFHRSVRDVFLKYSKLSLAICSSPYPFTYVTFEVFTAVAMKNAVFLDVAPCRFCINRRFGGTFLRNVGRRHYSNFKRVFFSFRWTGFHEYLNKGLEFFDQTLLAAHQSNIIRTTKRKYSRFHRQFFNTR
jgi:hypothetical protein